MPKLYDEIVNQHMSYINIKTIMEYIEQRLDNYYIAEWKNSNLVGEFRKATEERNVANQPLREAWRKLIITPKAYKQIINMQNNEFIMGSRKAKIYWDDRLKMCFFCKIFKWTIDHILLNRGIIKKDKLKNMIGCEIESGINFYWRTGL